MTQFDERERAFEKKFQMDEEYKFKSFVRAAKLFGAWAAKEMGMSATEAESYVAQIGDIAVSNPGHNYLIQKIDTDFKSKGLNFTLHRLEKELNDCHGMSNNHVATHQ